MEHIYALQTENHERRQAIACRRVSAGSALVGEVALSNLRTIATRCRLLAVMAVMVMFGGVAWGQTVFSGFTATSGTTGQSGQGYDKLVDNNTGTKWCIVQNNNTWSNTAYIEFEYATAFTPTGYILTTANDNSTYLGRNPKSWRILGKLNSGDGWTELVSVTNNTTMQDVNYTPYEFNLTNTTTLCKYFRFEVSAIQNGGVFQLSEIQFRDNNILMSNNLSVAIPCDITYNFYDSGGPSSNYNTDQNYTSTFTSDGNITINFSSFATESSSNCSNWDWIKIYDGTTSGTLLALGQTGCPSQTLTLNQDYTATSGTMTIVWQSDVSNTAAGWAATITATGCPIVECEGFEGGTMPTGWTQLGSGSWSVGVGDYHITTGSHSGSGNALRTHTSRGDENYLITPSMDFSSTSYATLSFWYVNRNWPDDIDELTVYYRVNGGAWLELFHTAAEHSSWTEQIINLPAGALAANCQIGFKYTDHYGYGVGIDDVCITYTAPATSCPTTISSLSDWDEFCDCVNSGTEDYHNKTVTLVADLTGANTISTMAGLYESGKAFKGTFEGNGHTINVNIDVSGSGNTGDAYKGAAPFRYIDGATIQNLKVTGSVTSSAHHTAGLVGFCKDGSDNTIYNCLVSTNVTNNNPGVGTNTNNYIGGIIGHTQTSTNHIIGCVYNGTLTSAAFKGGMFGFAHGSTFYITDSYFGGNYSTSDNFSPIGCKSASYTETINFNNYYYNKDAGNFGGNTGYNGMNGATITNNGNGIYKHAYSVTGVGCVTVDRGSATASYNVSGITAYSTGIKYNGEFYGGNGDELALILGCTSGGVNGYSADHGTLSGSATSGSDDPYTLTMDVYNTVISTMESPCPIIVINNTADWNAFRTCVSNGYDYSGRTVNLMANISVTTMAGNLGHPFRGTFEGNAHTITVDYTANYPDNNDHFTAPFICTDGATIQNLRIDGTINMGGFNYGSGLIGEAHGNNTITNCVSNVTINSSRSDDGTMGGFIVRNYGQYPAGSNEGTTTFNGCSFTGSLNGTNTDNCAGFVAWDEYVNWSEGGHYGKVVFNDCLFAPTAVTMSTTGSATFSRYRDDSKVTLNNSYYFQSFGTIQGKQAYSVTGIDGVTVDRNNVTATYSVSGITAYSTGIKYNSVFYGGDGDVLSLILNYGGSDFCGYAADYGSLSTSNPDGTDDPGNLTMVAHNTQISPATCFSVPICFDFNLESYSTTPSDDSGLPQGWGRVYSGTEPGYAPHVILNSPAFSCDGSRSILMAAIGAPAATMGTTSIVILPRVTGITTGTEITFTYKFQSDGGRLRLGYMNGGTFVSLKEIATSTTCADDSYTLTAAEAAEIEGNNRRLAFEWFYNTNNTARFVVIDDVCINAPVCDTVNVGDHSGTNTDSYLPSHSYYNYSLTQQIYTPCEIGKAGTLTSIAFYNGGDTKTRTYDIYLKTTANNTFPNTTAWIPVTVAERVYSGSVTMTAGAWTVIEFDLPFTYDGTSNLAVIMDDNTGGYSSGMSCRVYNADDNQAIRVYSDGTNYDPLNPGAYYGTLMTLKNQIKFNVCNAVDIQPYTISVSANPAAGGTATSTRDYGCHYTVTATPNDCYRFVNWTEGGTEVSTDATYSFTATSNRTLVANFEIRTVSITCGAENLIVGRTKTYSVSGEGLTDGQVTWSYSGTGSVTFSPNTGLSTTVTATSAGSGTITATISSCGGSTHTCTLNMIEVCDDPDTANVGDHSGTETHAYLPSHSNYRYALSQQIYKPCEIGKRGTITSIALFNAGSAKTRTYDIYLKTTANNTFANTTAWIPVTAADRVFSGSVTMAAGAWTVIEFDLPFAYDGTSNLVVIMDDNTGSYSSGMLCRVYNADGNQAIYQQSDSQNNDPAAPSYSGTLTNKKNQIKFSVCDAVDIQPNYTVTVSANPASGGTVTSEYNKCDYFTVNATPNDCYRFVNWTENGTEVSTDATFSFTATSNRTLVANLEAYSVSISSDPDPLTCLASGTEVTLTASTDIIASGNASDYTFTRTTGTYTELTSPTTILAPTSNTDALTSSIVTFPDGFTFTYCGTPYTGIYISDGQLRFGSNSMSYSNSSMLASTTYYNLLAPFLSDLYLKANVGTITYKLTGSEPNRVLTIQFKNVGTFTDISTHSLTNYFNFQVKLYEDGTIEFCYGDGFGLIEAYYSSAYTCIGINNNRGGTTYYQQITPTSGGATVQTSGTLTKLTIDQAHYITSGTIYRFTPPCPYTWTYTGTAGTANCATYTASPTQNSTYTVSVSGVGCTSKSASVDATLQLEATIQFGDPEP